MIRAILFLIFLSVLVVGCSGVKGNVGQMPTYDIPSMEAGWIRDGEPIEFENGLWYPTDEVSLLLDSEVYLLGEYKGTQYFVERKDVRPFRQLLTKFGRNQFRIFERRTR